MTTPNERERELQRREAELKAKERQLRLRELETEIYQEQKTSQSEINHPEPPISRTSKHNPPESKFKKTGRKIIKFAKFTGFMVAGIAIIKMGFFVGMWLTYFALAGIMAAIGYQIFLKDN